MVSVSRVALASAIVLLDVGCVSANDDDFTSIESASTELPESFTCDVPPAIDGEATTALETEIVAALAGATEITAGVRMTDRSSPASRQLTRTYLTSSFEALRLAPKEHAYGTGSNIYAELPSTTGGRDWIVVGAHFDSVARSPGANDNATGVALVHGVASYLKTLPCRTQNVVFVLFDQEEIGLVGSKAFAKKLERDGVTVRSVHTVDQMGWDKNGDRLIELERPDTGLAELYRTAVADLGVSIPIRITSTSTSDHSAFRPRFPAVGVTEGYRSGDTTPDYHRPTDTFDKVSFPYLLSSTALVARVLANQLR